MSRQAEGVHKRLRRTRGILGGAEVWKDGVSMEGTRSPCYLLSRRLNGLGKDENGLAGVVRMRDLNGRGSWLR